MENNLNEERKRRVEDIFREITIIRNNMAEADAMKVAEYLERLESQIKLLR